MGFYDRLGDAFARTRIGGWMFLHVFTPLDKRLMRWSNGALSSGFGTDRHGLPAAPHSGDDARSGEAGVVGAAPWRARGLVLVVRVGHVYRVGHHLRILLGLTR